MAKPRRLPNTRRALTADELAQINDAARFGGNDAILDALILRLHTETACRRSGALGLRLIDLDVTNGQMYLTEKGETHRWQPITLDLAARLAEHAQSRGAVLQMLDDDWIDIAESQEVFAPSTVDRIFGHLPNIAAEWPRPARAQ